MATTKKPTKGAKTASKKTPAPTKTVAKKATPVKNAPQPKISKVAKPAAKKAVVASKKVAPAAKSSKVAKPKNEPKIAKVVTKNSKVTTQIKKTIKPEKKVATKPERVMPKSDSKKIEKPVKKSITPENKSAKPTVAPKQIIVPEKKPKVAPTPAPATKAAAKVPAKPPKPVVIPKTSTDKKVDYEPDFLKSVLDTPTNIPSTPTMRYSDAELAEFRELINKKLDAAKKELAYLQGLITRKDEMGGDETDNRYMTMEDGGMSMEREQLSQMASRQITFIDHLEKAIMRIENKTYGVCRVTGKLIDKARLRAVPHATLSMEAKLGIVK